MKHGYVLIAAGLIAAAGATGARAFDEAQVQAVKDGRGDCIWCDLSGANLANIELTGVDLTGADLTEADLAGASLTNVDLTGADLTGANLSGATISGATLIGADIDQVDLSQAVVVDSKLEGANCDYATKLPAGSGLSCVGVTVARK